MFKIIIAGFGGQGVLSLGQILAYSAMTENKEVSWLPSYGPEMRGGTANCSVIISDTAVASPVIATPSVLVIMNKPSLYKFIDKVEKGGTVIINSSLVDVKPERTDINVIYVPANEAAHELGTEKAANIYIMGVINKVCKMLKNESIYKGIEYGFHTKPKLVDLNKKIYDTAFNKY
jgi:2-oxoglutarate ferredoxin oxidoreductase subunit gamma